MASSPAVILALALSLTTGALVVGTLVRLRARTGQRGPLGLATKVTLLRGGLIAALAAFIAVPPRQGPAAWLPGALYLTTTLCDLLDGYLARRRHEESEVGARLDVAMDALGLVIAPAVAIALGRLPGWYLLLGAAYYLFAAGLWLRARLGLPTFTDRLRPSRHARMFAGFQMGLVVTALLPVLRPPATSIAATIFMLPTLSLFARDWLIATGRPGPRVAAIGAVMVAMMQGPRVLLSLRAAEALGLCVLVSNGRLPVAVLAVAFGILVGVWVRVTSFAAAIALAFTLATAPTPLAIGVFVAALVSMLAGGGPLVVASPEAAWLLSRAGERSRNTVIEKTK